MSLTTTTLNGAITSTANYITLTTGTPTNGYFVKVDSEYILVQDNTNAPTLKVERGQLGTLAVAHDTLAPAVWGQASDFPIVQASDIRPGLASYGQAGAIAIPATNALIELCSGAASAMTLANPTSAQDGLTIIVMARDAFAYTVTNTSGFNDAGAGGDVGTFGGAKGDNFVAKAVNSRWYIQSAKNVTFA